MTAVTYPTFPTGREPSAAEIQVLLGKFASKPTNQSVTSSVTFVNDNDLKVTVENGATYYVEVNLFATGAGSATAGDIQLRWTTPGGNMSFGWMGLTNSVAYGTNTAGSVNSVQFFDSTTTTTASAYGTPSVNKTLIMGRGTYACTADGTLQLQWTQRVSSATSTTLTAGSNIVVRRYA